MSLRVAATVAVLLWTETVPAMAAPGGGQPTAEASRGVARLQREIAAIGQELAVLGRQVPQRTGSRSRDWVKVRFNDAMAAYFLKDYVNASILFFDIVEDPANRSEPVYDEALFLLGESLFQNRNFVAARKYFARVVRKVGAKRYQKALARMVAMALATGKHDEIDAAYQRLASARVDLDPSIPYLYGKSLHQRGRFSRALRIFASVPQRSPYFFRARFYLGAILAQVGRVRDAIAQFESIYSHPLGVFRAKQPVQTQRVHEINRRVVTLTHMALGRLHHDLGRLEHAAEAYRKVSRKSEEFPNALFELAHTWIKGKRYESARRVLEILMLSRHDRKFIPEAQVLLGDLQLLLKRFDDAVKTYESVKDTFEPIRIEMKRMMRRDVDPVRYFNAMLMKRLDRLDPKAMLPGIATRWVRKDPGIFRSMYLVKDLALSRRQVGDTHRIVLRLEAALRSADNLEMFPALGHARIRAIGLLDRALEAQSSLVALLRPLVASSLSPAERARHGGMRAALEVARAAFTRIPALQRARRNSAGERERRIERMEQEVHKMELRIRGAKAQLLALLKYRPDQGTQVKRDPALGRQVTSERAKLQSLRTELKALRSQLVAERSKGRGGASSLAKEDAIRTRYLDLLTGERKLLEVASGRAGGGKRALADNAMRSARRVSELVTSIRDLRRRLRERVAAKASELRRKVAAERLGVDAFRTELELQERRAERVVGTVAYSHYRKVRRKFYDLVIKAERGLAEVVWRQKELRSARVRQLAADRKSELKIIKRDFEDVLREE